MKKKIVSAVVAFCLVLGSAAALPQNAFIDSTSISVSAASTSTSGKCGDNVSWTLKDGVLTISGTGDMYYYNNYDPYNTSPFYERTDIKSVVIKNTRKPVPVEHNPVRLFRVGTAFKRA